MSSDAEAVSFTEPKKLIKSVADMKIWANSQAFQHLMDFLLTVNEAVRGCTIQSQSQVATGEAESGDVIVGLVAVLNQIDVWADQTEPQKQAQRFGNRAFSTLHDRVQSGACKLLSDALPGRLQTACVELAPYLLQSLGDRQRIDYGTGHELAFVMLLCCVWRLGALPADQLKHVALVVMHRYLKLVQKLQLRYSMEPAGSQGVWSLDDHQFVPYYWGSAQLLPPLRPPAAPPAAAVDTSCIADDKRAVQLADSYLLFDCIRHIHQVKSGPFCEHSSVLYSMSRAANWSKVNSGLLKMYQDKVLAKFPIVQHCLFGSVLSLTPASSGKHYLSLVQLH